MTRTAWEGPQGDQWQKIADGLDDWAASINWTLYQEAEDQALQWAYKALADLTAYAGELSDEELVMLEADRIAHAHVFPVGKPRAWSPRYSAWRLVGRSVRVVEATQANLDQLQALGTAAHDAGLAVVAQVFVRDPAVVDYLAGPWMREGHVFPRHARVSYNDFPAFEQGEETTR